MLTFLFHFSYGANEMLDVKENHLLLNHFFGGDTIQSWLNLFRIGPFCLFFFHLVGELFPDRWCVYRLVYPLYIKLYVMFILFCLTCSQLRRLRMLNWQKIFSQFSKSFRKLRDLQLKEKLHILLWSQKKYLPGNHSNCK